MGEAIVVPRQRREPGCALYCLALAECSAMRLLVA